MLDSAVVRSTGGSSSDIADSKDVLLTLNAELRVDGDATILLELEAGLLEEVVAGETPTPRITTSAGMDSSLSSLVLMTTALGRKTCHLRCVKHQPPCGT